MTVIAALVHRGRGYLAGDSRISDGADGIVHTTSPKVWPVRAGLVGVEGGVEYLAAIGRVQWPATAAESGPRIREALEAADVAPDEGSLLLISQGVIWELSGRALFPLEGPIAAAGSGRQYALGALSVGSGNPRERVRRAVEVASRWCSSCGGRAVVVSG